MSLSRAERRVAKKLARRDAQKSGMGGGDPKTRFAKRIAEALAEFGASGAKPDDAITELLTYSAEFAAFHGIVEQDFLEEAALHHKSAVLKLGELERKDAPPT